MNRAEKFNMMKPVWFDYLIEPDDDDEGFGEDDGWTIRDDAPEEIKKAYNEYLKEEKARREEANRKGILIDKI